MTGMTGMTGCQVTQTFFQNRSLKSLYIKKDFRLPVTRHTCHPSYPSYPQTRHLHKTFLQTFFIFSSWLTCKCMHLLIPLQISISIIFIDALQMLLDGFVVQQVVSGSGCSGETYSLNFLGLPSKCSLCHQKLIVPSDLEFFIALVQTPACKSFLLCIRL